MGKKQYESAALPNARLGDPSLYLKVFQLYFGGHPSASIARQLDMTPQSVNRALKKYRRSLVRQLKVRDYLGETGAKVRLPSAGQYVWFIENLVRTMSESPNEAPANFKSCFSQCPHVKAPQRFTFDHVDVSKDVQNFPHPMTPEVRIEFGRAGVIEVMNKRGGCRHCPFGAGSQNLAMLFGEAPEIYIDINYYLACQRIRSDEEYFFHLVCAVVISFVRRIAAMRRERAIRRGLTDEAASTLETRMQNRIVIVLFRMVAEPAPESVDAFGCFNYAGGSGSSSRSDVA